jgi:hypothetical protein
MFDWCVFNQDISKWDTSNVKDMSNMFTQNRVFNQDINTSVQTRKDANGNDEKYIAWDTKNVTTMAQMFMYTNFNGEVSNLNTSNLEYCNEMFVTNKFNKQLGEKQVQLKDSAGNDFGNPYTAWDTSNVKDMSQMFRDANSFNNGVDNSTEGVNNVGNPLILNLASCTSLYRMFYGAHKFNSPIYYWNTSNITSFYQMFLGAASFNQEIRTWDVSKVTDTTEMFTQATAFKEKYTEIDNPTLVFWANWNEYDTSASNLPWSDVDVTFKPHPNTVALWESLN